MKNTRGICDRLIAPLDQWVGVVPSRVLAVRAPARSEIAGNHTDHEGGCVIAGAVDRSIECLAVPNGDRRIRVFSLGYEPLSISIDSLDPHEGERVTSAALVRGMAAQMAATGRQPTGFDLVMASDIPSGGGLSSSAAYELAMCRAMEALWPGRAIGDVEAAQMAQRVEQDWFGKPCGLMDQLAVSLGGLAYMDFGGRVPVVQELSFDFASMGLALCLTDVGCDHTAYNHEYAAVPAEMKTVAQQLGGERLCEVDERVLWDNLTDLRACLGDRMILRALHYWHEMELVDARWNALRFHDADAFLRLTRMSGASSGMFLQNVSIGGTRRQDAMLAIALSERLLHGRGATRIHGGGFGGSIQAFVPTDMVGSYVDAMNGAFGEGACKTYEIYNEGAVAQWV